jgi:hypothetical protein
VVRHGEILSCHCGKLRGRLTRVAPETGSLVICYCRDCRAYARHLGAHAALDGHGGTEIYQTTPDNIEIEQGAEHLAALRLSEKGLIRWYASCCRTPVANTLARPGFAFAGMPVVVFPEPEARDRMGPLISAVFTKTSRPARSEAARFRRAARRRGADVAPPARAVVRPPGHPVFRRGGPPRRAAACPDRGRAPRRLRRGALTAPRGA